MAFNLGTAVGYLDLDTSNFSRGFKSAMSDLKTFLSSSSSATDKLASLGSGLTSVGSTLTKTVTLPLLGIGTTAVTIASGFESSMSKVSAISGATGDDLLALKDKAREMGARTKFSASEAADALTYMGMAGWKTQDMLDGLDGVMNLAAASGEDLATVSDILTDALTAFGLTARDSAHFADILAAASSNANTNVSMMGDTFKYVAPVAGALGYSVEDVAEAIGLMANAGIKGSQAGTSLRTILTELNGELVISGNNLEKVVIQTTNMDGSMRDLNSIIGDLRTAFSGLSESEAAAAAESLVGKEALSAFLALMSASPDDIEKLREAIINSDGAASNMADTMQGNLGGQIQILKSSLEELAISFGEILLPMVKDIVEAIQKLVGWMNDLSDEQKESIVNFAEMAAVIGPALVVVGKLFTGISKLATAWGDLSALFSAGEGAAAAGGGVAAAGGSLAGVLGIIGGVIAAIVALKLAWDNNFGDFQGKVSEMGDALSDIFGTITEFTEKFTFNIQEIWDNNLFHIRDIFDTVWSSIESMFSNTLDVLVNILQGFANLLKGNWSGLWDNLTKIVGNVFGNMYTMVKVKFDALLLVISNFAPEFTNTARNVFGRIKDGFTQAWSYVHSWFESVKEDPVNTLKSIAKTLDETAKSLIDSFLGGLKSGWESIKSWASTAASWLKDTLSISVSPSISTSSTSGSFASGLDYVPKDMIVKVHQGESIRTAQQTKLDSVGQKTYQQPKQPAIINMVVDGKILGKVAIDNINDLTDTNGVTPLTI